MKILFVHQNFPGQFKHLAPAMAAVPGNQVIALHINPTPLMAGVRTIQYPVMPGNSAGPHRWLTDLQTKVIRGEAAYHAATKLKREGFTPDVIVAHPGWGESLFLKDVWPHAPLGIYSEFYYLTDGSDSNFDPEFPSATADNACRLRMKNANFELHFPMAQGGLAPTHWQRSVFPEPFRSRISVMHDGIDTPSLRPNPQARMALNTRHGPIELSRNDEIITFVNRNLEPYRGYHIFMRALPALMRARPKARVMIVGGDGVSYGSIPPPDKNGRPQSGWRNVFLDEVKDQLDMQRVHFLGKLPYPQFVGLLQLSTVHVYLTYPFVLSWSLLEAMSLGCAIVASDTAPVREAIVHDQTGRLVNFFDGASLVDEVIRLCDGSDERRRLGEAARRFAIDHYDLDRHCLPGQIKWVQSLADCQVP